VSVLGATAAATPALAADRDRVSRDEIRRDRQNVREERREYRQALRYAGTPWRLNADLPGPVLREQFPVDPRAQQRLDTELYAGVLTRRGATRVHRLAWTVADLAGVDRPGVRELDTALRLRTGRPLELRTLAREVAR
jgi:magnesium chelatase family protein